MIMTARYILEDYILDISFALCPDMTYIFYVINETHYRNYADFGWEIAVLNIIFEGKLFTVQDETGRKWIVIVDSEQVENGKLPQSKVEKVEKYCRQLLIEIFEDRYLWNEDIDAVLSPDLTNDWTLDVFRDFCALHPDWVEHETESEEV